MRLRTSREWLEYYQQNAQSLMDIPWEEKGALLSAEEKMIIAASLKEFQLGESSEGRNLTKDAQAYAEKSGDHAYAEAIQLFIAEEQRHARDLARFMKMNGIATVDTTLADTVFRCLRNLWPGLELSVSVLITAEIIAKVYYDVLWEATQSTILRRLCDQILRDELSHVAFQADQLATLRMKRGRVAYSATMAAQRFLYCGTVLVVWVFHRPVIQRGGLKFVDWWASCWREFDEAFASAALPEVSTLPTNLLVL